MKTDKGVRLMQKEEEKLKFMPFFPRFQQNNVRASLDKLVLRNRGVGQQKYSGTLLTPLSAFNLFTGFYG